MIDANVNLHRWPFRRLAGDDPGDLVARLRAKGVTQAWAGSFEGLLHRDMAGVNARLAAACREHGPEFLVPFGCINPKLPYWQEDVRRCQEDHRMVGIRVYPNYHGYALDDPAFAKLLSVAANRNLVLQIALNMEDPRTQVVFGSHYPFFYFESALLKVREAGLPEDQANAVYEGNARALLGR